MSNDNNTQRCGACGRELPARDLIWVNDRYGIPYKRELEEEDD